MDEDEKHYIGRRVPKILFENLENAAIYMQIYVSVALLKDILLSNYLCQLHKITCSTNQKALVTMH